MSRSLPFAGPALASLLALAAGTSHPEAPPAGHTGGFGEPTCLHCHFDAATPFEEGVLTLGLESTPRPGETIGVSVGLHRQMLRAGFQLTFRTPDGGQAGTAVARDDRVRMTESDGITYVSQSEAGSFVDGDSARWLFDWEAPASFDTVLVHLVANAGNGDNSPLGDVVYQMPVRTLVLLDQ